MLNDLFVLTKIKEGDVKAFEGIFRLYYSPLCLYAAGITGSMDVAEEIVQELFYVFWKEKEKLQVFRSLKSYLYGAVRTQSLQYCEHQEVRNRYRENVLSGNQESKPADPQDQLEYKELEALINRTLNKLPERRLRIFRMQRFEGIFRLYYSPLCLYAADITGNRDVAEEIVQELFYVFWKEKEKLQVFLSLKSYLYGAVRNQSLQYCEHQEVRNRYRESVLSGNQESKPSDPQDQLEYKELEDLINKTLQKLPERRLRIFRMQRFEGKKYAEIASALSVSVKTVEAEMTRALQTLRKEIENYTQTV